MSLQRPRRIFRSRIPTHVQRGVAATCLAGLAGGLGIAMVLLIGTSSALFGRAPATDGEIRADWDHVSVIDGATLRLNSTVVELAGIRAPEAGRACLSPASAPVDCAVAATNALARLVKQQSVSCRLGQQGHGGRLLAVCAADGIELNHALVAAGWAMADRSSPDVSKAETEARAARRGLWREPPRDR